MAAPNPFDDFYRQEYGRVVSHLTHKFGAEQLEAVEDAVQEALYRALKVWEREGMPDSPTAWVVRTAQNVLLDGLRRQQSFQQKHGPEWQRQSERTLEVKDLEEELADDQLRMMFACCHPKVREEAQVLLTLKILCGFSNREVARALLKHEEAIAKAYTRAKQHLREVGVNLEVPLGAQLSGRLDAVLRIIYLLFNEGYHTTEGDALIKHELCAEALRLADLLLENPLLRKPAVHGLMSLMLFQASRFGARTGPQGQVLTLEEQDRSRWNGTLIAQGSDHLSKATAFGQQDDYTLQAAMAGLHALSPSFEATPWADLLVLYNVQVARNPSPVIRLNRAVVVQRVQGPAEALKELEALAKEPRLQAYPLYYAVRADAYEALGAMEETRKDLERARELAQSEHERAFFTHKLEGLGL